MRDYYDILGVQKNSSSEDIKKAYRKIAMKYHPDRNPDNQEAENKFKEAAEAYSVLSDEEKRQRFDQFGHAGVNQNSSGFSNMDASDIFSAFSDIFGSSGNSPFSDFFGGGGSGNNRRSSGENLKISIPLSLEEIYEGTTKKIKIKRYERIPNSTPSKCSKCNGIGEVRHVQQSMLGQIVNVQMCGSCNGIGYIGGRDKKTATISVKIPSGVSDGNYMTLSGEGNQSVIDGSGQDGDLIIYFEERPHNLFIRQGVDIYLECMINYADAILGTKVQVPTLNGKVKFKIPSGIKNGQILRLKGKGFKEVNRYKTGDQYIRITIDTPQKISNDLKKIILNLKNNLGDEVIFKKIEK